MNVHISEKLSSHKIILDTQLLPITLVHSLFLPVGSGILQFALGQFIIFTELSSRTEESDGTKSNILQTYRKTDKKHQK